MPTKCHFAKNGTKEASGKCESDASTFVRITHSKRLCPLCATCLDTFVKANASLSEEAKKAIPGQGAYELVTLEAGDQEYATQSVRCI